MNVPFNRPATAGRELEYVREAVASGQIAGNGPFTHKCERLIEELLGAPRVLLTTSCTDALEMSALLLDIGQGDEVIVPSFTFVSTANAFALRGATPVFADIRPDTLNLDEGELESLITPRTKAIVPMHYAGVGCEMDRILDLAARHDLAVVEDNAHGLLGRYRGRHLGTFGALATLSFHQTKNFTCGEGGALVINDAGLIERAEVLREKGTDRSRFLRGEVDKYTWIDLGSSFLPADLLAAVLLAQLEGRTDIQARRRAAWERYRTGLVDWAAARGFQLPTVPSACEHPSHIFYVIAPSAHARGSLAKALFDQGIATAPHYLPLHVSRMAKRLKLRAIAPSSEAVSERLLRLPLYPDLDPDAQAGIIDAIVSWRDAS